VQEGNQELIAASKLIDARPALVEAAARGIADSNLTILNGTQGVNEVVSGIGARRPGGTPGRRRQHHRPGGAVGRLR
jgi:hypothetical protein